MHLGTYRSALYGPQNTKKSLPKFSIGDRGILNKRILTNPKFSAVASRTNTGFNTRRKEELQKEINKYYKVSTILLLLLHGFICIYNYIIYY